MNTFRSIIERASNKVSEDTIVIYATALADSSGGEVLVRFDDDIPDEFDDELYAVDIEDEGSSEDELDIDAEEEALGEDDLDSDISADEYIDESMDGGMTAIEEI